MIDVCWRKYVLKMYFLINEAIRSFKEKRCIFLNAEKHRQVNRALKDGVTHLLSYSHKGVI